MLVINYGHTFQSGCSIRPNWISSGFNSCVFLSTEQGPDEMTWQEAHDQCISINPWSSLAVFPTDEHDAVIASKAKNSTAYWVGIQIPSNASRPYSWMDGSVETRNSIFPGNLPALVASMGSLKQLCGHVTRTKQPAHLQLSWSFDDCLRKHPYICIVDKSHVAYTTTRVASTTASQNIPKVLTTTKSKARAKTMAQRIQKALNSTTTAFPKNLVSTGMTYGTDIEHMIKETFKDFLCLFSLLLQQTKEGRLSHSKKNIDMIYETIDKFADVLVIKTGHFLRDNSSISSFSSTHLEFYISSKKLDSLRGKEINLRQAQIRIDNISDPTGQQSYSVTDEVSLLAMVSDALWSKSWLVDDDQSDRKQHEIRLTSPILTLSASVRGQLVSLQHRFRLTSYFRDNNHQAKMNDVSAMIHIRSSNSQSYWDTFGCQTIEQQTWDINRCHSRSIDNNTINNSTTDIPTNNSTECELESNSSKVLECHCSHTTSFAIIISVVDIQLDAVNALALDIITYIGCGLTIVSMCIAITVFTCIRSLDSERICVHRNLCVAILCSQLIFLMGVQAVENKGICRLVALLLHYFYMATFVWMLVEGLHLYSQVVRVFGTERSRIVYYVCFGWGFPFLEVAVSAAIDWEGYGTKHSCWLSIERSTIWAFVGPALSILFVNLLILTVVMRIIVLAAKVEKIDEIDHIRAGLKASLFLSPLLGITWLFGLAAVNKDLLVFQYIFSILNSLQILKFKKRKSMGLYGFCALHDALLLINNLFQCFFIFLYHCVFNTDVRQTLKRIKDKRMLQRELGTSSGSSQRASCSESGTDLTPKQSTTPVFKRIHQVSPEVGDEILTCHQSNSSHNSNKSRRLILMNI